MPFKLAIGGVIAFDVRFTLNDGGTPREFGFRCEADRVKPAAPAELILPYTTDKARVRMVRWLDDVSPLRDADTGADTPAGPEALAALYAELPNLPGIVFAALSAAMDARPVGPVVPGWAHVN